MKAGGQQKARLPLKVPPVRGSQSKTAREAVPPGNKGKIQSYAATDHNQQLISDVLTTTKPKGGATSPKTRLDSLNRDQIYLWKNNDEQVFGMKELKKSRYLGAIHVHMEKQKYPATKRKKDLLA